MKNYISVLLLIVFFSCDPFIVEDISEENVDIIAPSDNSQLTEGNINFIWNTIEDAEEYVIQIATPNFNTANEIITDSIVSVTSLEIDIDPGTYEWRVKAVNSEYETAYSSVGFDVIEGAALDNVTLSTPENDTTLTEGEITFTWEQVEDAESYTLQIASPEFDTETFEVITNVNLTDTSHSVTLEAGAYQWKVKAISNTDESEYSTNNITITE